MAGMILLFLFSEAQVNLNWLSSFLPSWANGSTSGTAPNVGGLSINSNTVVTMTGGGVFMPVMGYYGSQSPSVSGAVFTVPGTTNRVQVTPNYSSNSSYTNIVISFTSMVTNVSFRIADIDKSNANSTTYFDRVTVTGSNGTSTYNATLSKYDAVTDPNFLIISGNVAHVNTSSGEGENTASDATDQRGTVNVNFGATTLNSITIRYDNAPGAISNPASQSIAIGNVSFNVSTLPVSWLNFSGHRQSKDVVLNWSTRQEINAASFDIERNSGAAWETIGNVTARGNSNDISHYTYTDINPQGSVLLYRLKQIDIDRNFKYSSIIRIAAKGNIQLSSFPNPFTGQLNISVTDASAGQGAVLLYDATGRTVRTEIREFFSGNNSFSLQGLEKLSKGIYYLEIKDSNKETIGRTSLLKE